MREGEREEGLRGRREPVRGGSHAASMPRDAPPPFLPLAFPFARAYCPRNTGLRRCMNAVIASVRSSECRNAEFHSAT